MLRMTLSETVDETAAGMPRVWITITAGALQ